MAGLCIISCFNLISWELPLSHSSLFSQCLFRGCIASPLPVKFRSGFDESVCSWVMLSSLIYVLFCLLLSRHSLSEVTAFPNHRVTCDPKRTLPCSLFMVPVLNVPLFCHFADINKLLVSFSLLSIEISIVFNDALGRGILRIQFRMKSVPSRRVLELFIPNSLPSP